MQKQLPHDAVLGDVDTAASCLDDGAFVAGFRDCADHAVQYLTQVERLPENAAVIRGLRQHLSTREPGFVECERAMTANGDEGYTSMCVDVADSASVDLSSSLTEHDAACTCGVADGMSNDTDVTMPVGSTGHPTRHPSGHPTGHPSGHPTGHPTDDLGLTLARLVQRDPRIASLTKEIFDLIDGSSDDDDDEDGDVDSTNCRQ
ncbi:hypothetical protein LSAT2_018375 [Lamellibrachia satsuma]|nr:hypothetical protein LSAT2_018375 [Lamellibrachia satsuma]